MSDLDPPSPVALPPSASSGGAEGASSAGATAPPRVLRGLIWLGAALTLATFGQSLRYLSEWRADRAGRGLLEQRLTLIGVPFFKPAFMEFVERAALTIPEDARLLVAPRALPLDDGTLVWDARGQARWYLYLNHYLYPRQVFVRRPELASGTLVDYPRWLEHHFVTLTGEGADAVAAEEAAAIEAHGIDWRLTYPATKRFQIERVELERLGPNGWEPVALRPLPEDSPIRARRPASPTEDADEGEERGS